MSQSFLLRDVLSIHHLQQQVNKLTCFVPPFLKMILMEKFKNMKNHVKYNVK